jgi:predicted GNAT superfamily acetyltransferase
MSPQQTDFSWTIRVLETPEEMDSVVDLQRAIWFGSETDIVPSHLLVTLAHNGSVVIGAFAQADDADTERLVGFAFGFPGLVRSAEGAAYKFCSHQLGVHPDYRGRGVGFAVKRAQWQFARQQGYDRITWTYDPLLSRNGYFNIHKLGATCNTYERNFYGSLNDGLNAGLHTDRFQVDWWLRSRRVERRLSRRPRPDLDLDHVLSAGEAIVNPVESTQDGWAVPGKISLERNTDAVLLVQIPPNFLALKAADLDLALAWRLHSRTLFETLFAEGYLVTDFIRQRGSQPRSFYVLSHGESTF